MSSARKALPVLILDAVALIAVGGVPLAQCTVPPALHFDETGHTVREPFLSAYQDLGGLAVLGYPLSEAFTDQSGKLVQYFQSARLEQTPRGIQLGALGDELGLARPPDYPEDAPGTLFPQTGHRLDPAFSAYYAAHDGEVIFGPPIGPARAEGGLLLQDCERVRLVLDPALPADQRVRLGNLGSIALTVFPPGESTAVAAPPRALDAPQATIDASLSVAQPTLQSDALQTVYLHVVRRDNGSTPVADAGALVLLTYEGGAAQIEMPPTDANGISAATFQSPPAPPGTSVMVEAHVVWGDVVASVSTIYLQWW